MSIYSASILMGAMGGMVLEHNIGEAFESIPAVERVYVLHDGNVFRVFTIINEEDEDVIDRIYERELTVARGQKGIRFDFNVIARRGRPVESVIGARVPVWQRTNDACHCPTSI